MCETFGLRIDRLIRNYIIAAGCGRRKYAIVILDRRWWNVASKKKKNETASLLVMSVACVGV